MSRVAADTIVLDQKLVDLDWRGDGVTLRFADGTTAQADANLIVLGDAPQKNILSLSAAGRVREFELVRTFSFRLADKTGADLIPTSRIVMRRELTFNDEQVLAKEAEEVLLWRDMQNDLVMQLMRRLAAVKPAVASASAATK